MNVARLIEILNETPKDYEVVIVHKDWPIKKVTVSEEGVKIE